MLSLSFYFDRRVTGAYSGAHRNAKRDLSMALVFLLIRKICKLNVSVVFFDQRRDLPWDVTFGLATGSPVVQRVTYLLRICPGYFGETLMPKYSAATEIVDYWAILTNDRVRSR